MKWGVYMRIDFGKIKPKHYKRAWHCCCDKRKAKELLDKAKEKAKKTGPLYDTFEKLHLFFGIIHDWTKGNYSKIPFASLIAIFIALIYFVSPIDLFPDFLPEGYIDDGFVISLVAKLIGNDLEKYKRWKLENSQQA
jgi:uncharacterized membrane protein YkvA (DUF1232 family)